jgi:hypothetical protein
LRTLFTAEFPVPPPLPLRDFFVYFSVVACNDRRISETGPRIYTRGCIRKLFIAPGSSLVSPYFRLATRPLEYNNCSAANGKMRPRAIYLFSSFGSWRRDRHNGVAAASFPFRCSLSLSLSLRVFLFGAFSARIHNTMTELLERGGERNARYKMRMYKLEGRRAIN